MSCECEKRLCLYRVGDTLVWKGKFTDVGYDVNDTTKVTITAQYISKAEDGTQTSVSATVTPNPDTTDEVTFKADSYGMSAGDLFLKVLVNVTADTYKQYIEAQVGVIML